jgi:hypothetical protein
VEAEAVYVVVDFVVDVVEDFVVDGVDVFGTAVVVTWIVCAGV